MATTKRKALTGCLGACSGAFFAATLVLGLNLDSWSSWYEGLWKPTAEQAPIAAALPDENAAREPEVLALWMRLPGQSQVDFVMLGLTQAMERLGIQVQSMQVMADVAKSSKGKAQIEGPQALLSVRVLATYGQWLQWWESSRAEGVAWWPVQLSMAPAVGDARLQIEGQWRIWLSDQAPALGSWAQDVDEWVPAQLMPLPDPFGLKQLPKTGQAVAAHAMSESAKCPKTTLKSPVHGLQLVGLLEGGLRHPGQAVLRAGPCQWAVRVGQRVGVQGHFLQSLGPGRSVWLQREDHSGGMRLKLQKKEYP